MLGLWRYVLSAGSATSAGRTGVLELMELLGHHSKLSAMINALRMIVPHLLTMLTYGTVASVMLRPTA